MEQKYNPLESVDSESLLKNLEASRSRLRQALHSSDSVSDKEPSEDEYADSPMSKGGVYKRSVKNGQHYLSFAQLGEAVTTWWKSHPLYQPLQQIIFLVDQTASPWIRRYPFVSLGSAALLGGAVVVSKPWHWVPEQQWKEWGVDGPRSFFSQFLGKKSISSLVVALLNSSVGESRRSNLDTPSRVQEGVNVPTNSG